MIAQNVGYIKERRYFTKDSLKWSFLASSQRKKPRHKSEIQRIDTLNDQDLCQCCLLAIFQVAPPVKVLEGIGLGNILNSCSEN